MLVMLYFVLLMRKMLVMKLDMQLMMLPELRSCWQSFRFCWRRFNSCWSSKSCCFMLGNTSTLLPLSLWLMLMFMAPPKSTLKSSRSPTLPTIPWLMSRTEPLLLTMPRCQFCIKNFQFRLPIPQRAMKQFTSCYSTSWVVDHKT